MRKNYTRNQLLNNQKDGINSWKKLLFFSVLVLLPLQFISARSVFQTEYLNTGAVVYNQNYFDGNPTSQVDFISQYLTVNEGDACGQETPSNDFETSLGSFVNYNIANEFVVNGDETGVFSLEELTFNAFVEPGETFNAINLRFYKNATGGEGPGEEIHSFTDLVPSGKEIIGEGEASDGTPRDVVKTTINFSDPLDFLGETSETLYWVGLQLTQYTGTASKASMELTSEQNTPVGTYVFLAGSWQSVESVFGTVRDGVMTVSGTCSSLAGCSNVSAGEIMDDFMVCPNQTFTIETTGASGPSDGLTGNWYMHTIGTDIEEMIEGATEPEYTVVGGIQSATEYYYMVECDQDGSTDTSEILTVTVNSNPDECYCIPEGVNQSRYIDSFSTSGGDVNIDNSGSGHSSGGYGDFYDTMEVSQSIGGSVDFDAEIVGGTARFRIWVDWNQDGQFDVEEEVAYQSSSYSATHSGTMSVPFDAMTGETRMRIASHWLSSTGDIDPCEIDFTYGEFEDYKFTVIELEDCTGTPEAGSASVNPEVNNPGSLYTVSAEGFTIADGLSFQWQSNTNGDGWVDEGDTTDIYSEYEATAPGEVGDSVEWRLAVTCVASGETTLSETATFTVEIVYCNPSISTVEPITRVVFAGIDNSSSADSTDSFEDFTDIEGNVEAGESYDIALEGNTQGNYTNYFTVWVDWNHNGVYEESEMYEIGSIQGSDGTDGQQATGTIEVPSDALEGATPMRIIKNYNTSPTNPCGSYSYGQAEEYTVIVGEGEPTGDHPDCGQGNPSNNMEDALVINATVMPTLFADDFLVTTSQTLEINQVVINLLDATGNSPMFDMTMDITFYEDDNNNPGNVLYVLEDVTPELTLLDTNSDGGDLYAATFNGVNLSFPGASSGDTRYWIQPRANNLGVLDIVTWEMTTAGTLGELLRMKMSGQNWEVHPSELQAVFQLNCESGSTLDYCEVEEFMFVEPITLVQGAGIDNPSSASTDSPSYEDFTHVVGNMEAGSGYEFTFKGNTNGDKMDSFWVFIDWDQDGILNNNEERYEIGTITNSTGEDDISVSNTILVPEDAVPGSTRMRIIKKYLNGNPNSSCSAGSAFGQAEDYTIIVSEMQDCSGEPEAGTVSLNPESGFPGSQYTVSSSGYAQGGGITYQWQSNTDDAGWINEGDEMSFYEDYLAIAPDNPNSTVDWRLAVTCANSNETAYSNVETFSVTDPGDACQWTVHVWGGDFTFGDEVSWQLTDADGNILISGSEYDFAYDDTQTTFADGPLTFYAETMGTFNDNTMNYEVSNENGIIVSGFLQGGEEATHSDLYCEDLPPDYSCTGTPDGGQVFVYPEMGNPGSQYTVWAEDYTDGDGLLYQWQSSTDGGAWENEGNETSQYTDHIATAPSGQGVAVEWRLQVTCTFSGETAVSDETGFFTTYGEDNCVPETPSNGFEDGHGFLEQYEFANDFTLEANTKMLIEQVSIHAFVEGNISSVNGAFIKFYEDSGAGPDDDTAITPDNITMLEPMSVGSAFGIDVWELTFIIEGVELVNDSEVEQTYWMGVLLDTPTITFWEITGNMNTANEEYLRDINTGNWIPGSDEFDVQVDGVMTIVGLCETLGIENLNAFDFTYYPNPVHDVLNITSQKAVESVEVYNLTGQQVMNVKAEKVENGQIDVTQLSSGVYVFRTVLEGGQVETFKIIKR